MGSISKKEVVWEALESILLNPEAGIENPKDQPLTQYVVNFLKSPHMGFAGPPNSPFSVRFA